MDRATREHFIKIMQEKLEEKVQMNQIKLKDFEESSEKENEHEEAQNHKLIFIEDPKPMQVDELSEEEDDVLFPEGEEDDYELEDLIVENPSEALSEEDPEMEEESAINPEEETNTYLQTEQIPLEEESIQDPIQIDQPMVEPPLESIKQEIQVKQPQKEVKEERIIKTVRTIREKQSPEAKDLQEKFDKDYEVLKTMHRLELWELQKQHQKFEQQFREEFEEKLKNL